MLQQETSWGWKRRRLERKRDDKNETKYGEIYATPIEDRKNTTPWGTEKTKLLSRHEKGYNRDAENKYKMKKVRR